MFKLFHLTSFRSYSSKHGCIPKGVLERSISQKVKLLSENSRHHVILTLDPNKFAEKKQKRLNIGGLQSFQLHIISLLKQWSPLRFPRLYYGKMTSLKNASYPPDTKAFLYYFIPPGKPRIAGELRLRVASSDDLTSFESGSDLLLINGRTWTRPLCTLSNHYLPLYKKLREDQLIPDDLDAFLSTLHQKRYNFGRSHLIHTLHDTFIVDFSANSSAFLAITEQGVGELLFERIFFDGREIYGGYSPYTGSALARLERSTLSEHNGTRTVVLRFLKIITPVKCVIPSYDHHVCIPKEGELHKKGFAQPRPWSANIDKPNGYMSRGLQLLWDT